MAKLKDVKKAISVLENAKKQVIAVLGEMAGLSFMPIESTLKAELERAEAHNPFDGLTEEEAQALKDEARKVELGKLESDANERLAQIMDARSGKKPKPAVEESTEPDGDAEPNVNAETDETTEPDGDAEPNGNAETDETAEPDGDPVQS